MTGAKPSILFVHAGAEMYGADRILLELVGGLMAQGYPVCVVLPGHGPLGQEFSRLGIEPIICNLGILRRKYFSFSGLINRSTRLFSAVKQLIWIIRQNDISIVHSNTTAVLAGALASKIVGVQHIWHVHEITTKPRWFAILLAACVSTLSCQVVFVSEAAKAHMCRLYPRIQRKAVVIHNGIDESRAVSGHRGLIRRECGWSESDFVVGMIGRINWWKGQNKLVDCAEALVPITHGLKFLLVGGTYASDEQLRDQLIGRVIRSDLTNCVTIQDFRTDIGNVLADIDVFVLPSTEPDPFPTVVLEAMAASRPIVAFRHGGVCEMIENGVTGFLCEPCSSQEMASVISHLEANRKTAIVLGKAGLSRLRALYTREAFLTKFTQLYDEFSTKV